jgi:uncharacterized LabA/DUF88 family protein
VARYCVYIDGFNVYYALKIGFAHLKWANYWRIGEQILGPKDTLVSVVYFSAFVHWKPDNVRQHMKFIKAQRWAGVEVVLGKFMEKRVECHLCKGTFKTHEEKRTDVNLAVRVVADAVKDVYDRAVLVTADSDMVPVINTVHQLAPTKEVGVMFPIGRTSYDLRAAADFHRKMTEKMLVNSQLPETIPHGPGATP